MGHLLCVRARAGPRLQSHTEANPDRLGAAGWGAGLWVTATQPGNVPETAEPSYVLKGGALPHSDRKPLSRRHRGPLAHKGLAVGMQTGRARVPSRPAFRLL